MILEFFEQTHKLFHTGMAGSLIKDIALSSSYFSEALDFESGWICCDLPGTERRVSGTYGSVKLTDLPPRVPGDDADFPFMALLDRPSEREQESVTAIAGALRNEHGIELPEFFTKFMSSKQAQNTIFSCTAAYYSLGETFTVLGGNKGVALRFLRDQQDCCFWYIYCSLREKSKHCILCTFEGLEDLDNTEKTYLEIKRYIVRCSPDIVDFTKRFYIENKIWGVEEGFVDSVGLTQAMTLYVQQSNVAISSKYKTFMTLLALKDLSRLRTCPAPVRILPKDILQRVFHDLPI